jgi:phosphohistidine phosphatase
MELYIIRHAWAGNYGDPEWPNDDLRPLTPAGKKRFAKFMSKLAKRGIAPLVIATSPLLRCTQTAEIVATRTANRPEVVEIDALRPGSDLQAVMRWTAQQAERHGEVAWVGHSPDVDRLAAAMIGTDDGLIHFAKGGIAAIRLDGPLEIGAGELRWLATAKLLGC